MYLRAAGVAPLSLVDADDRSEVDGGSFPHPETSAGQFAVPITTITMADNENIDTLCILFMILYLFWMITVHFNKNGP